MDFGFWIEIHPPYIPSEEGGFERISSRIVIRFINPPLQIRPPVSPSPHLPVSPSPRLPVPPSPRLPVSPSSHTLHTLRFTSETTSIETVETR